MAAAPAREARRYERGRGDNTESRASTTEVI